MLETAEAPGPAGAGESQDAETVRGAETTGEHEARGRGEGRRGGDRLPAIQSSCALNTVSENYKSVGF